MTRFWRDLLFGMIMAAAAATLLHSSYFLDVAAYAGVLAIFALGVAVTFGQLGYASFGHAAFFGLGAYAAGLMTATLGIDYWWTVPLAVVPGLLLGTLVGFASARLSGAYFAIATLVVSEILLLVASNWVDLTRGPMGMMVTVSPLPGLARTGWSVQQGYLFAVLAVLAVAFLLLRNLRAGATGRAWIAIREAPALAESLGIATGRARVLNVAVSGGVSALAGALFVPKIFVLTPALFGVNYSAIGILAVILGGKTTLLGPMLGGALFAVLPEALRFLGELNFAAFALMLLVAVRLLPRGIVGWIDDRRSRAATPVIEATPAWSRPEVSPPSRQPQEVILSVTGASRHFRGLKAVQGVSFDVRRAEIVGLIGPNGAGKTTLLTMLSGFIAPSAGGVAAFGRAIAGLPAHRVARLGVVRTFQQTAVFANLRVDEGMRIAAHLVQSPSLWTSMLATAAHARRESERLAHALACLAEVGLADRAHRLASDLPYGEQKLLGVAMALATRPSLLLLDEPAAGLNPAEAQRLAVVLRALRDRGITLVIVDHNLKMLMSLVDRVVVLHHGLLIADGAPQDVVSRPDVVASYLGAVAPADVGQAA